MAVNPDNRHQGRHALFLGMTGSGKSALVRQLLRQKKPRRLLVWDSNAEHTGLQLTTRETWLTALRGFVVGDAKKQKLVYVPDVPSPAEWQWWCRSVWAVLDGRHETLVLAEELAAVCVSSGKATDAAGILINQGRKYGLIFWGTSQRPQEIEKTFYTNAAFLYVGQQKGGVMQRKMAGEVGVTPAQVEALESLQFWCSAPGKQPEKLRVRLK